MEALEHPSPLVQLINALLAPLHIHVPDHVVFSALICLIVLVLGLMLRSRLSVDNPGKLQIILEDVVSFFVSQLENWDRMLSFEGDTGPYLQYAHVRLASLDRKNPHLLPIPSPAELKLDLAPELDFHGTMLEVGRNFHKVGRVACAPTNEVSGRSII